MSFDTQSSTDCDVALVLQETRCTPSLDLYLPIARTAAPQICVIQSKIDLAPRDWSSEHAKLLNFAPWCRYTYNVECLLVSTLSGEGIDDLLSYLGKLGETPVTVFGTDVVH